MTLIVDIGTTMVVFFIIHSMTKIEVAKNDFNNTLQELDMLNDSPINKAINLTEIYHEKITLPKLDELHKLEEKHIKLLWPLQHEIFVDNNIKIEKYENIDKPNTSNYQ